MTREINKSLIGVEGSARHLQTPALVIDLDKFEKNVLTMARHCNLAGISLRPHSKTHKSIEIARRQIAAGAVGICCAKLGEAEVMGSGGISNILITSPVVLSAGIERLMRLNRLVPELMVVTDHHTNILALSAAAAADGRSLRVLLDLDPGLHRTGIRPGDKALDLAMMIEADPSLEFMGLQCYAGHLMHIEDFNERKKRSGEVMQSLAAMRDALAVKGVQCRLLTGGGTGTFDIDADSNVLTELQGGSYIFMDRQYNEVGGFEGGGFPFETSLFVQMSVVSNNTPRLATTDAGFKSFATDADEPILIEGAPEGSTYFFFGDEQGGIRMAVPDQELKLGSMVRAITPHCDPTVNLHEVYHVIQGDTLVDIWQIDSRGRAA